MDLSKWNDWTTIPKATFVRLIVSVIIILVAAFGRRLLTRIVSRRLKADTARDVSKEVLPSFVTLLAIGALLRLWLEGEGSLIGFLDLPLTFAAKLVSTVHVFLFYVGAKKLAYAVLNLNDTPDAKRRYFLTKHSGIVISAAALIMLVRIWIASEANVSTYLGLLSAGMVVALQDVIASGAGWVYLMIVRPFSVGERIRIGDLCGDVVDIRALEFSLQEVERPAAGEQPTGRIVHVPNSQVLKNPIANYHGGFDYIWVEMPVLVTFASNWELGLKLLDAIVDDCVGRYNEVAQRQMEKSSRSIRMDLSDVENRVYVAVADGGIQLTMRFLCEPRLKRDTTTAMWKAVLQAFERAENLELALPPSRQTLSRAS